MKITVLDIKNLNKTYRGMRLIKNFTLSVDQGQIYALIASDNSRRSLIIKLMTGLVKASNGKISFFGKRAQKNNVHYLGRIGILVEGIDFYDDLTALENINLYIKPYLKRISKLKSSKYLSVEERIEACFKLFNLHSDKNIPVKKYSSGMKQRLRLIRVFVIEPELIILDNPTMALDPIITKVLKEKLIELSKKEDVTIFITTAMLNFVDGLADEIGLLHHGEIIESITKEELNINQVSYLQIKSSDIAKVIRMIERELSIFDYEVMDDITLRIQEQYKDSSGIIELLVERGIEVMEVKYGSNSLESYFLDKIGD